MSDHPPQEEAHQYAQLTKKVMKQQAGLSLRVAAIFILLVLGLPLFNAYFPKTAGTPLFGFSLTWLVLGVCFFPLTWILSAYFIRESDRIETDAATFKATPGARNSQESDLLPAGTRADGEDRR